MGAGPMRANAFNNNIHGVGTRVWRRVSDNHSRGDSRGYVERKRIVRCPKRLPNSRIAHSFSAADTLLCRLTNKHQGSRPITLSFSHNPRSADQTRDMHIVTTGVHS